MKANQDVRNAAKTAGIKLWEIAVHLGVGEATIMRWMRISLSADREKVIMQAIAELAQEKQKEG